MKRKFVLLLLAVFVTGFVCLHITTSVNAAETNVKWTFDEQTGTLTFTGQGKMETGNYPAWHDHRKNTTAVVIGEGITSVGNGAFTGFNSLETVSIPSSLQEIGDYAFSNCSKLVKFPFNDNITHIGAAAFSECSGLLEFVVPSKVTVISRSAFHGCIGLQKIVFHSQVTKIEQAAFEMCFKLTDLKIPDSVTEIELGAFSNCIALKSVDLGNGIRVVNKQLFSDCTSLTEITIPDSVTVIHESAFSRCKKLEKVTIGAGISEFSPKAFDACTNLKEFFVSQDNAELCSVEGVIYSKDKSKLVVIPGGYSGIYAVVPGTTRIGKNAGSQCEKLVGVIVPGSVSIISDEAFSDCSSLQYVYLEKGVTYIRERAFWNCPTLSQITFPKTIAVIEECAFGQCLSLTDIAFLGKLPQMQEVKMYHAEVGAFYGVTATVRIPEGESSWINRQNYGGKLNWVKVSCSEHVMEEWKVLLPSTEAGIGMEKRHCTICGWAEAKELAKMEPIPIPTNPISEGEEKPATFPWIAVGIGAAVLIAAVGAVIWLRLRKKQ